MEKVHFPIQVRWADIDANRHLRHSAYYDYGAAVRMFHMAGQGITPHRLEEMKIGPVLFREEAVFRREIRLEDKIFIGMELTKAMRDFSRWSIRHHFYKEDGTVAAILTIDAAWMDIVKRKLTTPPDFIKGVYDTMSRSDDFEWLEPKAKPA